MAKKSAKRQLHDSSKAIWIILVAVAAVLLFALLPMQDNSKKSTMNAEEITVDAIPFDFGNQTITLDDQLLVFTNGSYTSEDGQSSAKISHSAVSPSRQNGAAILTDTSDGSGTFLYVIGASLKNGKEFYSEPVLIGDRINIVSVSVEDAGAITVSYFDRSPDESMANETRQETTKKYAFQEDGNLIEVLK